VCVLAAEHICALRSQFKNVSQKQVNKYETAS